MAAKTADQNAELNVADDVITLDRRSEDRRGDQSEAVDAGETQPPRRKKQRRRHIDPTTCERDYSEQEIEFMRAMDDYKRDSGRMFPTCSEVLEVIRALGYFQLDDDQIDELELAVMETGVDANTDLDDEPSADEEAFAEA